jgi:phosphoglycerol transferase MdoB-like AlkP superfamily enzyme
LGWCALNCNDTIIHSYASQTDIATTLLKQMDIETSNFKFGKDIFSNQSKSFAFFTYNNGFGFVTDSTSLVFDNNLNNYSLEKGPKSKKNDDFSKAYVQVLMKDFIAK